MDWITRETIGEALRGTFTPPADDMDDEFARLLELVMRVEADDNSGLE